MSRHSGNVAALVGSCLWLALTGSVCDDVPGTANGGNVATGSDDGLRSKRFVVISGDGVPDYGDIGNDYDDWYDDEVYEHDSGHGDGGGGDHGHDHGGGGDHGHDHGGGGDHGHDHGGDDDDDDDDGDYFYYHGDGPGYHHHWWWHHFYHHGEPHLPFPLFPPIFVHRRPVHRGCSDWPFVCRSTYEVIRWLQCYHEFVHDHHDLPPVHVSPWRK
ncbi:protein argonaute 18-like [Sipha flava]|uniref:Protein argonaute 18-like n=2 Tax=Sipha flava TaxID=143950 RepID=A0A8B8GEP6_9HEMI|nr:protein argonaute 18-like [Sipha flava]